MTRILYANPEADLDRDGITNFYEYATLTDPLVRNNKIGPRIGSELVVNVLDVNTSYFAPVVRLKVRRNQADLIYTIEGSDKMEAWTPLATYDSANYRTSGTNFATVTMGDGDILTARLPFLFYEFFRVKFGIQQ